MPGVGLFLLAQVLTGFSPPPQAEGAADSQALVQKLGAARYADREAAARALEHLGREAIAALQSARDCRDLEIRTRARGILQKIQGSLLTEPTMVRLDFHDLPLAEIGHELTRRTGMKVVLFPENVPRWTTERISLEAASPLTFWKAIDGLCAAASLQTDLELHGVANRSEPILTLSDRIARPVHPVSDFGPFRVSLVGLEYQRRVAFAPAPRGRLALPRQPAGRQVPPSPQPVTTVQCTIQLQVAAEPRLAVSQAGPVRIREANDDRGSSLCASAPATSVVVDSRTRPGLTSGGTRSSVVHLRASLHRPENPGQTIKVLRGEVPLKVMARQPEPLVVPLASASGKSFEQGDLHVIVHEVRGDPNTRQRQIDLSVRLSQPECDTSPDDVAGAEAAWRFNSRQQSIEVVDSRGQVLPWHQSSTDMEGSRMTLTVTEPAGSESKELRYYRLSETTVSVPFAFTDLPMP
jgi:hypothetical protein